MYLYVGQMPQIIALYETWTVWISSQNDFKNENFDKALHKYKDLANGSYIF